MSSSDIAARLQLPWVESPFFEQLLPGRGLTAEQTDQARFFHEHGYLVLPDAFPERVLDRVREEVEPLFDPAVTDPRKSPGRFHDAWKDRESVRRVACDKSILKLLERLYGRRPIPFQTLNFQVGSEQRPHADTIHFNSLPPRFMCGVWVALEDMDPGNGTLVYYPGSHRLPQLDFEDLGLRLLNPSRTEALETRTYEDYPRYEETVQRLLERHGLEPATLTVKKGTALLWAAGLVHGGGKILEPGRTRWSQVTHYYFEGCLFYQPILSNRTTGDLYLKKVTDACTGEVVPSSYRDIRLPPEVGDDVFKLLLQAERPAEGGEEIDTLRALTNPQIQHLLREREELRRAVDTLQHARIELEAALAAVEKSTSLRLGRLLTAPARWLRRR